MESHSDCYSIFAKRGVDVAKLEADRGVRGDVQAF